MRFGGRSVRSCPLPILLVTICAIASAAFDGNPPPPQMAFFPGMVKVAEGGLSNLMFLTVYKPALVKAGWDILNEANGGDALLLGHYTKNGRNLWAYLHKDVNGYTISVADVGATDLNAGLKKSCHVALYGVLFDFNKATLQTASDPVLQKVADILQRTQL
jgi:hypothetical protein